MTPPPVVTAHVWRVPADIALTPLARPKTSTGTLRSLVVPSPSPPKGLSPQHLTPPALVSAQVELQPTAMAGTPPPGWAYRVAPQPLTPPRSVSAQAGNPPGAIALTPLARPETSTGTLL